MSVGHFVYFKQTGRVEKIGRGRLDFEGENFIFPFWSDKSTKWATDDGEHNFECLLLNSNHQICERARVPLTPLKKRFFFHKNEKLSKKVGISFPTKLNVLLKNI